MWCIYLLQCGARTYVGSTTNVVRRLRQHNRELVGGARATAKLAPGWSMCMYISGFPDRSSACRFEALVKKRARGLSARSGAMSMVFEGKCPPGRGPNSIRYVPPTELKLYIEENKK